MKKMFRRGIATLLVMMLSIQMLCIHAVAAEHPSIKLPVTIEQKGDTPYTPEELDVVLTAKDAACPMPEGSVEGVYTLAVKAGTTGEFPEITFPKLGIYNYTIHQEKGDHSRGTYDETVYQMRVYVTNAESGEGFESTTLLYIDDINTKYPEIKFVNHYKESSKDPEDPKPTNPTEPTIPPTKPVPAEELPTDVIEEAFDPFGVLGAFDENLPFGVLGATGDETPIIPILAVMAVCAGIMVFVIVKRKKKSYEE